MPLLNGRPILGIAAAAALLGSVLAQSAGAADLPVRHRHHHHARSHVHAPGFHFSYHHNYGPVAFFPGGDRAVPDRVITPVGERPYAYYDGPRRFCRQSSPSYRGQDGRRHPCE